MITNAPKIRLRPCEGFNGGRSDRCHHRPVRGGMLDPSHGHRPHRKETLMTCSTCNGSRRVPWPEAGMMQDCPTCKTSAQADVERVRANRQAAKAIDFGARYTTPEPMTGKGLDIWGRELGLTRNFLEDDGALRSRCREAVRQRQVFRNDLDSVRAITMPVLNAIERVLYQARADGLNVRFTRDGSLLTITIGPPA